MEPLGNKKIPKNPILYSCEKCHYNTCSKKDYNKHLNTVKHNGNNLEAVGNPKNPIYSCEQCDKVYQTSAGLWKHNKKCGVVVKPAEYEPTSKELIMILIKENAELKNMMMDVIKNGTNNTTTNSHNKTFNLQFFLNETCKDAINLTDFADSIVLTVADIDNIGEVGLAKGLANRIISELNLLGETKRPIHCTDVKREVMYVKDNNKWVKDIGKDNIRRFTKIIDKKLPHVMISFSNNHNKTYRTDSEIIKQQQTIYKVFGGEKDEASNEDEIIRLISKSTFIKS